jgi:lauroyl/myristoyl acyltransferase
MGLTIDTIAATHAARFPTASEKGRMLTAGDVLEVPRMVAQGLLAWTLPQSAWWPFSRLFAQLDVALHPERTREEVARIEIAYAGTSLASDAHRLAVESWANRYEDRFHYLRAWRPGGWEPEIEIGGGQHVAAALERGRGIVFLGGTFSFNHLVTKIALHRLGLRVSHFSRPTHGFSDSRFGIRYLNGICRVVEDRYLGERLITQIHSTADTLRRMGRHLMDTGCVSFTVGDRGRRTAAARFLNARLVLATGPLALAWRTGATVLPVYTLRQEPGRFEVTIGEPIEIEEDADGEANFAAAVQAYADRVTPYALRDPGQWRGWRYVRASE